VLPTRESITNFCKHAENEAKNNPEQGKEIIDELITQTAQLLEILDIILPPDHLIRASGHDEVASQILRIDTAFTNKTRRWRESLAILEKALQIAVGAPTRQRIENDINIDKTSIEIEESYKELHKCWFCKQPDPDDKSKLEVKMHGEVTRTRVYGGTQINYRHTTITVPRCKRCKSGHKKTESWGCGGLIAGAILAFIIGIALQNGWIGFLIFIVIGATGYIIAAVTKPKGIKPESYKAEFPSIKQLLSKGWHFGDKPSN
jgi:hypothetical protein